MTQTSPAAASTTSDEVLAAPVAEKVHLDAAHPAKEWSEATPVIFSSDWQGKNPDPQRQTEVRVLWSADTLYVRFVCNYRTLHMFEDAQPNGRRDHLWDGDVAEAFLQPDPSRPRYYKEFEVAPNGYWIDLDITPGPLSDLKSNLQRSVWLDPATKMWAAELAIPMKALTTNFDPLAAWRANFYRVEGDTEPRFYSAWQPTNSPQPNFHVPSAFGKLRFARK
jgi:alpha-galactosidase